MSKKLYDQVRYLPTLINAWKKVRSNGIKSNSEKTVKQIEEFSLNSEKHIRKIKRQLTEKKYTFSPSRGIPIERDGKAPRPIVNSEIKDRIVQRSILDVLQSIEPVKQYTDTPTSFGGLAGKKVEDAIKSACLAINNGCQSYLRSDIKGFFTQIPRQNVISTIIEKLPDDSLNELLDNASRVELENLAELGEKAEFFPDLYTGVAQGCCLSPLFGNVLLHGFDRELNSRDVVCLRYIDDFLILGPDFRSVNHAFGRARKILKIIGLDAYPPGSDIDKATIGATKDGFDFLGCTINKDFVLPNKKSRNSLKQKVHDILAEHSKVFQNLDSDKFQWKQDYALLNTLQKVNNLLKGWGNQYSFCNAEALFRDMDREIDNYVKKYFQSFQIGNKRYKNSDKHDDRDAWRIIWGVHLLTTKNEKRKPILPLDDTDTRKSDINMK